MKKWFALFVLAVVLLGAGVAHAASNTIQGDTVIQGTLTVDETLTVQPIDDPYGEIVTPGIMVTRAFQTSRAGIVVIPAGRQRVEVTPTGGTSDAAPLEGSPIILATAQGNTQGVYVESTKVVSIERFAIRLSEPAKVKTHVGWFIID